MMIFKSIFKVFHVCSWCKGPQSENSLCWLFWLWGADVHAQEGCDHLARSALLPQKTEWCCSMVSGCPVKCSELCLGTESRDFHFTLDMHYTNFIPLSFSCINQWRQVLITSYINKSLLKDWKDIWVTICFGNPT